MTKFLFATNNKNKVQETREALANRFEIVSLKEAGIDVDIAEPHNTLEANAIEKALFVHKLTQLNCFSEDTGLEVEALHGEPGVKSARYAGDHRDFGQNIIKVLQNLQNHENRKAQFRTVICLILDTGEQHLFEGICSGRITKEEKGNNGFGYDSIFIPDGANLTFAEMSLEQKNAFSHRKKAVDGLVSFITNHF